jgi:hypothetical protein
MAQMAVKISGVPVGANGFVQVGCAAVAGQPNPPEGWISIGSGTETPGGVSNLVTIFCLAKTQNPAAGIQVVFDANNRVTEAYF